MKKTSMPRHFAEPFSRATEQWRAYLNLIRKDSGKWQVTFTSSCRKLNSSRMAASTSTGPVDSGPRTAQVTAPVESHSHRLSSMARVDWMRQSSASGLVAGSSRRDIFVRGVGLGGGGSSWRFGRRWMEVTGVGDAGLQLRVLCWRGVDVAGGEDCWRWRGEPRSQARAR